MEERICIVTIHGFALAAPDPLDQMSWLVAEVSRGTSYVVEPLLWWKRIAALRSLRRGTLGSDHTDWLQQEFQTLVAKYGSGVKFLVIAYSAGGYILYRWLAQDDIPGNLDSKIKAAVIVAAPTSFSGPTVYLEESEIAIAVQETPFTAEERFRILSRLQSKAAIIVGSNDLTIPSYDALFDQQSASRYHIQQTLLPDATHLSVLQDGRVAEVARHFAGIPVL